ncbi:diguanylate cyclase domain-containing protein [Aciditerrimonas ferrireducens]|uniref:diguanylate cyclase domain-containing protein n=1 Tax=Aciditerrimonas ferrireducens TaxID=667306 RepID=UPI00200431E0|nr:GGDEF domain-containing protein [Aciditerrimonas ferrireducens]MCK4178171.1 GGDEF domain-containing protein [Aciditerrimonas ferrireducens]
MGRVPRRRPTRLGGERARLGAALAQRAPEVLARCQEAYLAHLRRKAEGPSNERLVRTDPMWQVTDLATHLIARWLGTGVAASPEEREQVAATGATLARQRAQAARLAMHRPGQPAVPVGMVMRLNVWWADAVQSILREEARRLGVGRATLAEALDVVVRSARWSTLQMLDRLDEEMRSLEARLSHLALHDPLTGVANRSLLLEHLERALARLGRRPGELGVFYVDLDGFKALNDTQGHAAGDELLRAAARTLQGALRAGDLVARVGGDEFVAVCEQLTDPPREALQLGRRLCRALRAAPVTLGPAEVPLAASTGIVSLRAARPSVDELLRAADRAMYHAKRHHRSLALLDLDRPRPRPVLACAPARRASAAVAVPVLA